MKIISGTFRNHNLYHDNNIKATLGSIRKTIMDIIGNYLLIDKNNKILDLCSGTGALGLEALSIFDGHSTFIDINPMSIKIILKNINHLKIKHKSKVICGNILSVIKTLSNQYNLLFLDPPYHHKFLIIKCLYKLLQCNLIHNGGIIVIEQNKHEKIIPFPIEYKLIKHKIKGNIQITILQYNKILNITNENS